MQPIKIFDIIARRRMVIFGVVLVLIFGVGIGLGTNSFLKSRTAKAAVSCDNSTTIQTCTFSTNDSVWNDGDHDGANIIISGSITVTSYGHHKINSLIIKNNGILTHAAISWPNDFTSEPGNITSATKLNSTGVKKVVDLEIAGTLSLQDGGKIDVTGKGYPGGSINYFTRDGEGIEGNGYGPGGGGGQQVHDEYIGSGGGGYGGRGANGWNDKGTTVDLGGKAYGNGDLSVEIWHGSGGGAANRTYSSVKKNPGFAGGGMVKIIANNIVGNTSGSGVFADGQSQDIAHSNVDGGAGSGGSIYVELTGKQDINLSNLNVNPGQFDASTRTRTRASVGLIQASVNLINNQVGFIQLSAAGGGLSANSISGEGGGGIINVVRKTVPLVSIHKSVARVLPLDGTSPYNLKPGDIIQVTLNVTNLVVGQQVTIKDEIFNDGIIANNGKLTVISGSDICKYTSAIGPSALFRPCNATLNASPDPTWIFTPLNGSQTVAQLQYNILVK